MKFSNICCLNNAKTDTNSNFIYVLLLSHASNRHVVIKPRLKNKLRGSKQAITGK